MGEMVLLLRGDIASCLQAEITRLHFPGEKWHSGGLRCASGETDEVVVGWGGCRKAFLQVGMEGKISYRII